jgi:FkbM family methyltransferase
MQNLTRRIRRRAGWMLREVASSVGRHHQVLLEGKYEVKLCLHSGNASRIIEREAHDLFVSWLSPGVRVLDLGANMGRYSLYAAFATSRQCRVLAVEADRATFHVLVRNLELNSLLHVVSARCCAAWDCADTLTFFSARDGRSSAAPGWASILVDSPSQVEALTVDEICRQSDFRPDVIKMDIEGAECRALRGMSRVLRESRPKLLIEVHPAAMGEIGGNTRELEAVLRAQGYGWYDLAATPVQDLGAYAEEHKLVQALPLPE